MGKRLKLFLLFFVENLFVVLGQQSGNSERVTLIGPRFLPVDSNYKAFLSRVNLSPNAVVNVTLSGAEYEKVETFNTKSENNFDSVEFKLPSHKSIEYTLSVTTTDDNSCKTQDVSIRNLLEHPVTFIYLDKPIYKIGDQIRFRIFTLDQQMLPFKGFLNINATFYDAKNNIIFEIQKITTTIFGLFERTISIQNTQNFGDWRVDVRVNDRKMTKYFKVQRQFSNTFNVFVDMADTLAYIDKEFPMNIFVKGDNEGFFAGTAQISLKIANRENFEKLSKQIDIRAGKNEVILNFNDDLHVSLPSGDLELTFEVLVTEKISTKYVKVIKKATLKHQSRNTIQVIRKKYFKPGFKFPIRVKVKLLNGLPDNSFRQLKMTVEYVTKSGQVNSKNSEINLKNGETSTVLQPTSDTVEIVVKLSFGGIEHVEKIPKFSAYKINEFLQVSFVNKSTKIGDMVKLQAQSSGEIETLNLMVFGSNGLVYSNQYSDAIGKDIYTFSFELTSDMKPEIRGLVFYIRPSDGIMVHDEFVLSLGFSIENSLEISTLTEVAKPGQEIDITVKSEIGSLVLLTAIDANTDLFSNNNEISRGDIYEELTYFQNISFSNLHDYKFEKVNSFVLEPLLKGYNCGTQLPGKTTKPHKLQENVWTQHYFPKIWFDTVLEIKGRNSVTFKQKLPYEGTWKIYGISINPTKGFTVSKTQPKVTVSSDISMYIDAPLYMHPGEITSFTVSAFHSNKHQFHSNILMQIYDGEKLNIYNQEKFHRICKKFNRDKSLFYLQMDLKPNIISTTSNQLYVQSVYTDKLIIKASASIDQHTYTTEKHVIIKNREPSPPSNKFKVLYKVEELRNNEAKIHLTLETLVDYNVNDLLVEVEMPTGYIYTDYEHNGYVKLVYLKKDVVVFEMRAYHIDKVHLTINAFKKFDVYQRQSSFINVIDAKIPNEINTILFKDDPNEVSCEEIKYIDENCGSVRKFFNAC